MPAAGGLPRTNGHGSRLLTRVHPVAGHPVPAQKNRQYNPECGDDQSLFHVDALQAKK